MDIVGGGGSENDNRMFSMKAVNKKYQDGPDLRRSAKVSAFISFRQPNIHCFHRCFAMHHC